jgi:hypothetical protein
MITGPTQPTYETRLSTQPTVTPPAAATANSGQEIDDVVARLKSGRLSTKDVQINVVVRDGSVLMSNTLPRRL